MIKSALQKNKNKNKNSILHKMSYPHFPKTIPKTNSRFKLPTALSSAS